MPLKAAPLLSPLVCFRVVTKGDYPLLVKVPLTLPLSLLVGVLGNVHD